MLWAEDSDYVDPVVVHVVDDVGEVVKDSGWICDDTDTATLEEAPSVLGTELSPGAHLANLERTLEVTGALLGHFDAAGGTR